MSNFTLFTSGSAAAGSAGDYVQDVFQDVSLPATTNTGLTDSASTNPLSQKFLNDDNPKYGIKTLYIKDAKLVDKSLWLSNKPTYEIIFDQVFPGIVAYAYGNVRLRNYTQGVCLEIRDVDDVFGVTAVARRVLFMTNPTSAATGTADIIIDGSDTAADVTFGAAAATSENTGYNKYNAVVSGASNQTKDIHDFRIRANEQQTLRVVGVQVYFENATFNLDFFPGSTYNSKDKKTTTTITAGALSTVTSPLGSRTLIYKSTGNTYTQSSIETPSVLSLASGSANSQTVTVTTGHGSSFPIGTGVVATQGTSIYVGSVTNVSTDTLTTSVSLPFALSGATFYSAWRAGPTLSVSASYYQLSYSFDPGQGSVQFDANGFGKQVNGDFYFQDASDRYRIWGDQLKTIAVDGNYGLGFNGATVGFFQVDGRFSAVDAEIYGYSAILHGTLMVNGVAGWGINETINGYANKTFFTDAGPGWNSCVFNVGASFGNVVFTKLNFYERRPDQSVTTGLLAQYDTMVNQAERTAVNATQMQLGTYQRVYADQMYLTGAWTRGTTTTAAGGVYYGGASLNSVMNLQYFGKDFALIGTAGGSMATTLDGASISSAFNSMKSVASLTFHTVSLTWKNGATCVLQALDFTRTHSELINAQSFVPRADLVPGVTIITQTNTPQNPKSGTIWAQYPNTGDTWIYLFNRWNKFGFTVQSEDPSVGLIVAYGGA